MQAQNTFSISFVKGIVNECNLWYNLYTSGTMLEKFDIAFRKGANKMTEQVLTEVVKVKKEKVVKEPKEPRLSKKWTKETWEAHVAAISVPAVPEGHLIMSEIVKQAIDAGIKKSRICTAMGGDRAANLPWEPFFAVVYVGGRKYGSTEIITRGFPLLLDPEYHKTVRKGRAKKEKIEGEVGGKKLKLKKAVTNDGVWIAKGSVDPRTGEVKE